MSVDEYRVRFNIPFDRSLIERAVPRCVSNPRPPYADEHKPVHTGREVANAMPQKVGLVMPTLEGPMSDTPFQTMAEVDEYLSGNTIECLICAKSFQRLNRHLQYVHNIAPERLPPPVRHPVQAVL